MLHKLAICFEYGMMEITLELLAFRFHANKCRIPYAWASRQGDISGSLGRACILGKGERGNHFAIFSRIPLTSVYSLRV